MKVPGRRKTQVRVVVAGKSGALGLPAVKEIGRFNASVSKAKCVPTLTGTPCARSKENSKEASGADHAVVVASAPNRPVTS